MLIDRRPVRRGQGAPRRLHDHQGADLDAALEWGRKAAPRPRRCRSRSGRSRTRPVIAGVPALAASEIERVFREEYGRAVAVLVRVFGDIDVAEEAVQDAFAAARRALAGDRAAAEPGGLDHHHRPQPGDRPAAPRGARATTGTPRPRCCSAAADEPPEEGPVRDDRLRLIFTCCHPALAPARAGRADAAAARRPDDRRDRARLPRARADHGAAAGAGQGQDPRRAASRTGSRTTPTCPTGCAAVLAVVYLIFNEGYTASSGDRSSATTCAPRRSGSAGCWPS